MNTLILVLLMSLISPPGGSTLSIDLRRVVEPWVEANDFSGVVLVARGNDVIAAEAFGMADRESMVPMRRTTRMYIGSVSKSLTALAILTLRDDGKLAFDDSVSQFIPEFPGGDEMTIEHLLTHRSGLKHNMASPEHFEQARRAYTTEEAVALFADTARGGKPGERFIYANPNYTLLALIVERASGESFGAFMSSRVFTPLGMTRTGHHDSALAIVEGRARGYSPIGMTGLTNARWYDYSIVTGAGSLYSTVDDLLQWCRKVRSNRELAKYAWHETSIDERTVYVANGWDGVGFTASIAHQPDGEWTVVVLANINISRIAEEVATAALEIANGDEPHLGVPGDRSSECESLSRLAGRYQFGSDFYVPNGTMTLIESDGALFEQRPDATLIGLIPMPGCTFLHRSSWGSVSFSDEGLRMFDRFDAVRRADD